MLFPERTTVPQGTPGTKITWGMEVGLAEGQPSVILSPGQPMTFDPGTFWVELTSPFGSGSIRVIPDKFGNPGFDRLLLTESPGTIAVPFYRDPATGKLYIFLLEEARPAVAERADDGIVALEVEGSPVRHVFVAQFPQGFDDAAVVNKLDGLVFQNARKELREETGLDPFRMYNPLGIKLVTAKPTILITSDTRIVYTEVVKKDFNPEPPDNHEILGGGRFYDLNEIMILWSGGKTASGAVCRDGVTAVALLTFFGDLWTGKLFAGEHRTTLEKIAGGLAT